MQHKLQVILGAVLGMAAFAVAGRADAEDAAGVKPDGIVLAHVRFTADAVEVLETHIAPGRLKPTPARAGDQVLLEVLSATGTKLWQGSMADPYSEVLEGGAIDSEGHREAKVVRHESREMTVRVPFFARDQVLRVVRVKKSGNAAAETAVLGTFQLPAEPR